jgi:hypothetical protein
MEMFILAQQQQPQQKQMGQAGILFFAGRLSAHSSGPGLAAAMKAEAPSLQPAQVQAELPRCGNLLQAEMHNVETGFNSLRPPGAPAGAPPAAGAAPGVAAPAPSTPSPVPPVTLTPGAPKPH